MKKYLPTFLLFIFLQLSHAQVNWKPILSQNTCVLLGEQAHGVQSFYHKKKELIAQIGTDSPKELLLLIESPLVLSILSQLTGEGSDYHYHHTNTAENIQFFSQYENFGFDLQEDCRYKEFSKFLVKKAYVPAFDPDLVVMDSLLSFCILGKNYRNDLLTSKESAALKSAVLALESKVLPQIDQAYAADLLRLCFENRLHLAEYLRLPTDRNYKRRIEFRDSIMSENIQKFMALYAEKQVVVWAANLHIGKKGIMGKKWTKEGVKSMAEYLDATANLYRIAIVANKRKQDGRYFDKIVTTNDKVLVDKKYLEVNCE
jgi:hypothetical protein